MTLKNIIEALVFASQKPLMPQEIVQALKSAAAEEDVEAQEFAKVKADEVVTLLGELKSEYAEQGRSFQLIEQVNGWHVVTTPACGKWVRQLYPESKPSRLSGPALETLAIVAYRQPITKADIEAVRGVAVDGMMQTLLEKGLVRIAGRADIPGRPLLYETTEHFLEHFGLRDVDELPNSAELRRANLPKAPVEAQTPALAAEGAPSAGPENETSAPESPQPEDAAVVSGEETPQEQPEAQPVETVEEPAPVDEPSQSEPRQDEEQPS